MKIPIIKKLVENYSLAQLKEAETALYEEQPLNIEVDGDDEGEQLTHILAAIYMLEHIDETGCDVPTAMRAYTSRVRSSIN